MDRQPIRVEPVQKHTAPLPVRKVLEDIQQIMGIPWPPASWRCYAMYPAAMLRMWDRVRPSVNTGPFLGDAIAIADHAYRSADDWYRPAYQVELPSHDLERLRWELDAFAYGNPQILIQQAALSRAFRGQSVGAMEPTPEAPRQRSPYRLSDTQMVEEEQASVEVRALYDDIRRTLGLPIVNSDYKAMAKWPAFFRPAWDDIKRYQRREELRTLAHDLGRMADEAADRLNPALILDPNEIHSLLGSDEEWDNLRQMVHMFTELLPGLIVNVAMLRVGATAGRFVPAPRSEPLRQTKP